MTSPRRSVGAGPSVSDLTPDGSSIDATESVRALRDLVLQQQGQIVLQLRDHGRGVPEDALARLGSHFFRASTHQHLPGHGIGLASVRAIMQLHQGSIVWRNASPGLDTRITLPTAA